MANGIEYGISQTLAYANDNTHGYVLHSRDYSKGTDCAGLMRYYAAAVEGTSVSSYPDFGTWNQKSVMTARGWTAIAFNYSKAQRGDIFLRALGDSTGHTVLYLGNGQIVGAEADKDGRSGDSSGREITQKAYYAYSYNWILRPPAKYQTSSNTSSSTSGSTTKKSSSFAGRYRCTCEMNVRDKPSIDGAVVATYKRNETVYLDSTYYVVNENHGDGVKKWCWGTYIGSKSGKRRYICVGRYTGKQESDDLLVKVG